MFSGRIEVLTDADGWILIDRNGKHFGAILNYLRDGTIPLPDTRRELKPWWWLQRRFRVYSLPRHPW